VAILNPKNDPKSENPGTLKILIVLTPRFSMLALTGCLEVFCAANKLSEKRLFSWSFHSVSGNGVVSSTGLPVIVHGGLIAAERTSTIVLIGGDAVPFQADKQLINWIQRHSRIGVCFAALCSASILLAKAGLLNGRRATVHWPFMDYLIEFHPKVDLRPVSYTIHDRFMTAAGGTSSIDLFLEFLERRHGGLISAEVSESLNYTSIRALQEVLRTDLPSRRQIRHPKLIKAINIMENSVEEPVSPATVADTIGISTRQLERLFKAILTTSPKKFYIELRLSRSYQLLISSDMSVIEIAIATGFKSASHFAKIFRARYGASAYQIRLGKSASSTKAHSRKPSV